MILAYATINIGFEYLVNLLGLALFLDRGRARGRGPLASRRASSRP